MHVTKALNIHVQGSKKALLLSKATLYIYSKTDKTSSLFG